MKDSKKPLVLTIDDEEKIRSSFRELLEDYNYDVIEAEDGSIGLEIFMEKRPDLILVDMNMPKMGGLELLENVTRFSLDTPIIVISGAGEIKDVVKALRLGAWDYLVKPIRDMTMLIHTIERALERRRLIMQNREYHEKLEDKVEEQTKTLEKAHQELQESEKAKAEEFLKKIEKKEAAKDEAKAKVEAEVKVEAEAEVEVKAEAEAKVEAEVKAEKAEDSTKDEKAE